MEILWTISGVSSDDYDESYYDDRPISSIYNWMFDCASGMKTTYCGIEKSSGYQLTLTVL